MVFNPLESGQGYLPLVQQLQGGLKQEPQPSGNFTDTLKDFIGDVNTFQRESGDLDAMLIRGEPVDLHDVMIASEKAKTSFQLLVEIRNKFLDLYQQVNRMQI